MSDQVQLLCRDEAALLVIDVQERINAVMASQGHVPRIAALIEAFRSLGRPVLVSEQYPKGLGSTVAGLGDLLEPSSPSPAAPLVKDTFSCVRDAGILAALDELAPRQVVVTGIEAHVCVVSTVLDLLRAGYEVHVPHDAVCSRRIPDRDWALHRMASAGASITTTESVLFELVERCGTDDFRTVAALVKTIPVEGSTSD
jgi:nicotinamidase-related amidase